VLFFLITIYFILFMLFFKDINAAARAAAGAYLKRDFAVQ